jgi:acylphosphatase
MVVKTARVVLNGKVQGVFFRDFAKQNANRLGIVGYAKNLKNGQLEIVAQGEEKQLEEFIKHCRKGPMFAKIEGIDITYEGVAEGEEFEYFDIRYS